MERKYSLTWDLDVFFSGGSDSPEFHKYVEQLEKDVKALDGKVQGLAGVRGDAGAWKEVLDAWQDVSSRLREANSYTSCLMAQNVKDEKAKLFKGRLTRLGAELSAVGTQLDRFILELPQPEWEALIRNECIRPIAFPLKERRQRAAEQMTPELERLAGDLSVDGYHGWGELYHTVVGRIRIPWEEDGENRKLSVGQANNKLNHGDRNIRKTAFERLNEAWAEEAELCAAALNHLAGYRLSLYRHRGWNQILKEPLELNRVSEATLHTMWNVIEANKPHLVRYLRRKAELLGLERLSWYDLYAPLNQDEHEIGYDEAAKFIMDHFRRFSPDLADFAKTAFEQRWIEAEDRPDKRPGGFCTHFPKSGQSRIFMTYSGTASNVGTLAHELGHAYHGHVLKDLPVMAQRYSMSVAETASTFAETIVADASIRHAASDERRLALLEDKIQRALAFFMDIHARFLFETSFYERRKKGPLSVGEINELMISSEKRAFCDALSEYHPYFWAARLHFYITGMPFYNFPYTFGYLFSTGIYGRALEEGPSFARKYVDLLRDTGRMTAEDLARKHLGVDLTRPDFWQSAVDLVKADIDAFLKLSEGRS